MVGERSRTASRYAATLAGSYVVAAALYIVLSGQLAVHFAADLEELHDIELYKGLAYVTVTGTGLFALALVLFQRLLRSAAEVAVAREAILRADRQVLPGLLAASIAHDFRNALMVACTNAEVLEQSPDAPDRSEVIADLRTALEHASELARDLSKAGSTSASGEARELDVTKLVSGSVDLVRRHRLARARSLRCEGEEALRGEVFPTLVQQIVTNLALNALDAVSDGGRVEVRTRRDGDAIVIEVHDDGPGVPERDRERIFDPFFTTKEQGTGLGLVSVRTCAQLHAGDVEVARSELLGGALFRVTLRSASAPRTSASPARA